MLAEPVEPLHLLTDADRQLLFAGARQLSFQRGEVLFHEGAVQSNLYIVRYGLVRVERKYRGHGIAVARYGPGELLGESAFLEEHPAFGSAIAEEEVGVDLLEGQRIHELLASDGGFASRFYRSLAVCLGRRLRHLPETLGSAGPPPRLPRLGQISEQQFPEDLTKALDAFRMAMHAIAAELKQERLPPSQAQDRVNRECDAVIATLDQFTNEDALLEISRDDLLNFRDLPDLARGVGGYVQRETFPFFFQSATIAQGLQKARGFGEDRELLERIERNQPAGEGRLGPLIDQWFLERPLCRSRRNSLRVVTGYLQEAVASITEPGPVRLTSLSAGTAREAFDLLNANKTISLYVTCIDGDADTLSIDAHLAQESHCADRITFLRSDLSAVMRGQGSVSLGLQHVIYGLGVCENLDDEQAVVLLNWIHDLLVPGGWVVLSNRDASSPDRAFTEHILDWAVKHRTRAEFRSLFAGSKFGDQPLEIQAEDAGVNLISRCRKS
ncbi:MAG TPA: cyclic nucleotide-binding domain-containing protein [Gemmataceae bacterium]|nr:cyclic nucleotide-binding domain-containing protein [Gemmataceae bacterium]